jgi:hypothetical protein
LTSTVKKQLGAKVSAVTLFEAPTVASLATLIESRSQPAGTPSATVDAGRSRGERRREKLRGTAPLGA